jgi:hypothetical protein
MVEPSTGHLAPVPSIMPTPRWSAHLGADRSDSIMIGALLLEPPNLKSVVVLVHATAGGEIASVVRGLTWSATLGAYYAYFPTERRWLSKKIVFSRTIDCVDVQMLALPSRTPLGSQHVVRVLARSFARTDDRSPSLHLLKEPLQ